MKIDPEIEKRLGDGFSLLSWNGYKLTEQRYYPKLFGNFLTRFRKGSVELFITTDRSIFEVQLRDNNVHGTGESLTELLKFLGFATFGEWGPRSAEEVVRPFLAHESEVLKVLRDASLLEKFQKEMDLKTKEWVESLKKGK